MLMSIHSAVQEWHQMLMSIRCALQEWDQKSVEFSSFRRRQEASEEMNNLKLNALLITPVQRIPRFVPCYAQTSLQRIPRFVLCYAQTERVHRMPRFISCYADNRIMKTVVECLN